MISSVGRYKTLHIVAFGDTNTKLRFHRGVDYGVMRMMVHHCSY